MCGGRATAGKEWYGMEVMQTLCQGREAQGNGTTQMVTSLEQGLKQEGGEPQKLTFFSYADRG